jgi:hypothetical protein
MKRFKELAREGVEPDTPSIAARTYKEKPNKEPMAKLKEEQLEEGRPSQRHPLEGHEYHKKSNDELVHIAKDAHKAAEAMKSHNTTAENKYRDQANDSATVRHFRQKSGMPDWYKKKYGHMKEENDTNEKEEMVQSQLHFIKYACEEILEYIDDGGEVEEWYQVKVAKSFSEFESLHAYMEGESRRTGMKEETEKFPFVAVHAKKGMHQTHGSTSYEAAQNAAKHWKMKSTAGIDVHRADKKHVATESVEQIDEISAETKSSYTQKATKEVEQLKPYAQKGEYKDIAKNIITRRQKGIAMAKEEFEQINELSKDTLKSYADKATSSKDIWGNPKKSYLNRIVGISRASEKLKKEEKQQGIPKKKEEKFHMKLDKLVHKTFGSSPEEKMKKEEVEMKESVFDFKRFDKMTKGEYPKHDKIARSLTKTAMDTNKISDHKAAIKAHKNAITKLPHDSVTYKGAHNSFIDDHEQAINKKRNVAEEVEQIDEVMSEPNYNQSIKARQEKADKDLPFTPDPPKKKSVVAGKHGEAYSRVRHLARQALKKQSDKLKPVKESLDESRKTEIVKEIMKKKKNDKDKDESFQKDPVLSSEIVKA